MSVVRLYEVELVLRTPGGVSARESLRVGSVILPSLPLARDGWGGVHVPATSLTGSLRQHAGPEAGPRLFGEIRKEDGKTVAAASPVWVLGTRVEPVETHVAERGDFVGARHGPGTPAVPAGTQARTRTAMDRRRAAATASALQSRELLPPGTRVTAWFRYDGDGAQAAEVEELLATWQPVIGGGRTTGQGRAEVTQIKRRLLDLSTAEGRRHWLLHGGPGLIDDEAETVHGPLADPVADPAGGQALSAGDRERLLFGQALTFDLVDALHIGTGQRAPRGKDGNQALLARDHNGTPYVPGTTWKGVLRARCEFILRSMGGKVCHSAGDSRDDGTCGACLVCEVFGWTRQGSAAQASAVSAEAAGARGRLVFLDSPITGGRVRVRQHVAIDRVFGGARDGLLFAQETVESGTVDLYILAEDTPIPAAGQALLLLALLDLHDGLLGLGAGTTRGCGTLRAASDGARWLEEQRAGSRQALGQFLTSKQMKELTP